MEKNIELGDILDMDVLQRIQDSFAEATGLAAIIVDREGNPLLEYSNFSDYCRCVRDKGWCETCYRSDAGGGINAALSRKPQIYMCHAGLVDLAVPIFVSGSYVGAFLAGQARVEPEFMEEYKKDPPFGLSDISEELTDLYETTYLTTHKKIHEAARLMYTIANYLTEMAHVNMMQQELHEKDLRLSEETRLRSEAEAALMEADLKALKAQINPHFLFNVLNTIGRFALLEGAQKTQEMVYQFADLMRYNLKQDSAVAETVGEMLTYVKAYLSIQKFRLGERLRYTIEIDESCMDCLTPVMTVQPFIENIINYVVEPRVQGGSLSLKISKDDGHILISLKDDGPGMSEELIEAVLNGTYRPSGKNTGIGINNVNKRLKYYFGQEYGVKIYSEEGEGCEIRIRIPNRSIKE